MDALSQNMIRLRNFHWRSKQYLHVVGVGDVIQNDNNHAAIQLSSSGNITLTMVKY